MAMSLVGNGEFVFEKSVSVTDTTKRLAFPARHVMLINPDYPNLPHNPLGFIVMDGSGNPYRFELKIRKEGNPKPDISGNWLQFVRHNNLKPGDRVRFYKHNSNYNDYNQVLFTVTVRKQFWLFGFPMAVFFEEA